MPGCIAPGRMNSRRCWVSIARRAERGGSRHGLSGPGGAEGGRFDCAFPEPRRHQFRDICDHVAAIGGALADSYTGAGRHLISEHDLAGRMVSFWRALLPDRAP
ncbi:MAG: hypothetical protein R3D46_06620 [Defluviimonas denitrificans]